MLKIGTFNGTYTLIRVKFDPITIWGFNKNVKNHQREVKKQKREGLEEDEADSVTSGKNRKGYKDSEIKINIYWSLNIDKKSK